MFERVAGFVLSHYRKIIVCWLVAALVATPVALQVTDVVTYQQSQMTPPGSPAEEGQDVLREQFGSQFPSSSALVVVRSDDPGGIYDAETRRYVSDVRERMNDSDPRYYSGSESVYSAYRTYVTETAKLVVPKVHRQKERLNRTLTLTYGVPISHVRTYRTVNQTATLLYGVPQTYVGVWQGEYGGNLSAREAAKQAAWKRIAATTSDSRRPAVKAYYEAWYAAWNSSLQTRPNVSSDARLRASVLTATQRYANETDVGPTQRRLLLATAEQFGPKTWTNRTKVDQLARSLVERRVLQQVNESRRQQVESYYAEWHEAWWAEYQRGSSLNESAKSAIDTAYPALLTEANLTETERSRLENVVERFTLSNWDDDATQRRYLFEAVANSSEEVTVPFLRQAYSLGEDPSDEAVRSFSRQYVENGSIGDYSLPVPASVRNQFVGEDNRTMVVMFSFTREAGSGSGSNTPVYDNVHHLRSITDGEPENTEVYVTGEAAISLDLREFFSGGEEDKIVTFVLLIVLVGLAFRSVAAPMVSISTISVAVGVTQASVVWLATTLGDIHFYVTSLLAVVLLGVGTDYSIFILSRYYEERKNGVEKRPAVGNAVEWAGESVATSGATVLMAFVALGVSEVPIFRTLSIVLGAGVAIAVLAALSLIPSVLLVVGDRAFWPANIEAKQSLIDDYFRRAAQFSLDHSKAIVLLALVVTVPTTMVVASHDVSYNQIEQLPETESTQGIDALQDGFGSGTVMPTYVVVTFDEPVVQNGTYDQSKLRAVDDVTADIESRENVRRVLSPTEPGGQPIEYQNLDSIDDDRADLKRDRIGTFVGEDNRTVVFQVVFDRGPFTGSSMEAVREIRDDLDATAEQRAALSGATVYTTGQTAQMVDTVDQTMADLPAMLTVLFVGMFLILLLVLGSVLVPIRAIVTMLLSISWTLAITYLVFAEWLGEPISWFVPIDLFFLLMGLGMDYDVFLITRIREEVAKGMPDAKAITEAVERTGGIITTCGVILAAAFGSLLLSEAMVMKQVGFALAVGILIDTFLVRVYLVPAIMQIGGRWNWWAPSFVQRTSLESTEEQ